MSNPSPADEYSDIVCLFPLPNLVFFPHVVQPLHIFETRYRQMMTDALAGDRLLAMALLRPGWEEDYDKAPPIHPVVCVGRIFQEEKLADGRYNLLLHGLARARILEEVPADRLYRRARVEWLSDVETACAETDQGLRKELSRLLGGWLASQPSYLDPLRKLLEGSHALGGLCDIFSFVLPLDLVIKQQLLAETEVERRVRLLLEHLEPLLAPSPGESRKFPPDFSSN